MIKYTSEDWERITLLCRQVANATERDYGYIYDNPMKLEDVLHDAEHEVEVKQLERFYTSDSPNRLWSREERSRIWSVAADKDTSQANRELFLKTVQEVKAATIKRIEKALGRSISDL